MTPLTWTRELPTVPGWYWLKEGDYPPWLVEVSRPHSNMPLRVYEVNSEAHRMLTAYPVCPERLWAGPLTPPPQEPA